MSLSLTERRRPPPDSGPRTWIALVLLGTLVLGGVAVGVWWAGRSLPGTAGLARELRDRGRTAVVGGDDLLRITAEGAELIASRDVPGLDEALAGTDEMVLTEVLVAEGIAGVLVDGRSPGDASEGASVEARLRSYANMESLRGVYLTPTAALYERRRDLTLEPRHRDAVARAARQLVGGSGMPRIRAFPEPIRRSRNVEVMVMLEQGGRPRLWRSARGGSIARALVTAASVARQRWAEREQAMGGSIDDRLPRMTVKVYLLEEDGTLDERSGAFVERVFSDVHGVAFEHRGSWHYLLPRATAERGGGSAMVAYSELFSDAGLAGDSLTREDLRPYRLVAREVGTSPPAVSRPGSGSSIDALSPDDSLGQGVLDSALDSL